MDTVLPTVVYSGLSAATDTGSSDTDGITKDPRPVFTGTVSESATVTVVLTDSDGTRFEYTTGAAVSGAWTIPATGNLPQGHYDVSVSATDKAGNTGPAVAGSIDIDFTVVGGGADTFGLTESSDSGTKGDQVTKDTDLSISGTVEAGTRVNIASLRNSDGTSVDISAVGSVVSNAQGRWELTLPLLGEGTYTYTVHYVDLAGNVKDVENTLEVDRTINITARFASETGHSDDVIFTNDVTPEFTGSGALGDRVSVILTGPNGFNTELSTTLSSSVWSLNSSGLTTDGTYSWVVTAQDAAGNTQAPIRGSFVLDTTDPVLISVGVESSSDTGLSDSDGVTRDTSPNFLIQGETGAKAVLQLWSGNSAVGQAKWTSSELVITNSGVLNLAYPEASPLEDGRYVWRVTLTDIAGNVTESEVQTLVIDTVAPTISDIDLETDSGSNTDDWITNDNTPLFSGRAEAGTQVTMILTRNGVEQGVTPTSVQVGNDGTFSYQLVNTLNDGSYEVKFVVTDVAGNTKESSISNLEIDTAAPPLTGVRLSEGSDSGISSSDSVTKDKTPQFEGNSEAGATISLVLSRGDNQLGPWTTVVSNVDGSWTLSVDNEIEDGEYSWRITATDIAGNVSAAATGEITVDTQVSQFDVRLSDRDDTGFENNDNITNKTSVSLTGNGENNSKVSLVSLAKNGTVIDVSSIAAVNVANGIWSLSLPALNLGDGEYSYTVKLVDTAGNSLVRSGSVTLDTAQPILTAALDSDSDSGTSNDGITNDKTPTFVGTVSEQSRIVLKLYDGDVQVGETYGPVMSNASWSISVGSELADGNYTWEIIAEDIAGNQSSQRGDVVVDTVAPSIVFGLDADSDTGTSQSDNITKDRQLEFKGSVSGEGSRQVELRFEFYRVGAEKDPVLVKQVSGGSDFTFDVVAPVDGSYQWKLIAIDAAGNQTQKAGNVVVDTVVDAFSQSTGLDPDSDSGTSDSDSISNDRTPTFTGATEPHARVTLTMVLSNNEVVNIATTAGENGSFILTVPEGQALQVDGDYSWTLTAQDTAGNLLVKAGQYTLDTHAPVVTYDLAGDTGNSDDWITKNTSLEVSGTSDTTSNVEVTLKAGQSVINQQSIVPSNGRWVYEYANELTDGTYTVIVTSTDAAGNTFQSEKSLVIDTQLLNTFKLYNDTGSSDSDNITNADNLEFRGQTDSDATVTLSVLSADNVELYSYNPTVSSSTGQWSFTIPVVLPEGSYKFSVSATDVAGNTQVKEVNVEVDRTPPPLAAITLDSDDDTGVKGDWITKDTQVSINGLTVNGAKVTILISGQPEPVSVIAGPDGRFSVELPDLSFGNYQLTITATDVAGNSFQVEQHLTITPDSLPFVYGLDSDSDSGIKNDNVTNVTSPTLSGTATPGYTVEATLGGVTYRAVAGITGAWSINIGATLTEGPQRVNFVVKDASGNVVPPAVDYTFIVDTSVLTSFSLDGDSDSGEKGDFITNAQNIYLQGVSEPGARIVIKDKSTSEVVTELTAVDGGWGYLFSGLSEGLHTFIVELRDPAGNENTQEVSITVDRTAPTLTVNIDDRSDVGKIVSNEISHEFSGTAVGADSVTITINGVQYNVEIQSNGTWSKSFDLHEGFNNFTVTAADVAGNITTTQGIVVIKTSINFLMNLENDNGLYLSDKIISGHEIRLGGSGGVGDNIRLVLTGLSGAAEEVRVVVGASGLWSASFDNLSDSTYSVVAHVTDDAGNSLERVLNDIVVDNVYTSFSASLVDEAGIASDNNINYGQPNFSGSGEAGAKIYVTIGERQFEAAVASDGRWEFRFPVTLSDGGHVATIYSKDLAGNTSESVTVNFAIDTGVPTVTYDITGVVDNDGVQYVNGSQEDLIFNGTTSEAGKVILEINNQKFEQVLSGAGNWSLNVGHIVEQEHAYTLTFEDIAGNKSVQTGSVTIDRTIKTFVDLSAGSDSGAVNYDNVTNIKSMTFNFASQGYSTDSGVIASVQVTGPGGFSQSYQNISTSSSWTMPAALESDGDYSFSWSFVDPAGNTANRGVNVRLDTTIDALDVNDLSIEGKVFDPNDGKVVINSSLVSMNLVDHGYYSVDITANGTNYNAMRSSGGWLFPGVALSDGINNFTITAYDSAGNRTTFSDRIEVKKGFDVLTLNIDEHDVENLSNVMDVLSNNKNGQVVLAGNIDAGSSYTILVNGKKTVSQSVGDGTSWNSTLTLEEGSNRIVINFTDIAGNEKTVTFNAVIDTIAPIITVDGIQGDGYQVIDDTSYIKGSTVNLNGRIEVGSSIVAVLLNGQAATFTKGDATLGEWNITVQGLVEGDNTIVIKVQDAAGNTEDRSITIDRDLSVELLSGVLVDTNNDNLVNSIAFSGQVEIGASVTVEITSEATGQITKLNASVNENGNWTAATDGLADGRYNWIMKATDAAGNSKATDSQGVFTLDTEAPLLTASLTDADNDGVVNSAPVFSGTVEVGSTVVVELTN
ncbi:Ig-like domain-containing protein, partial [Enterovibrio nigricans]